MPLQRITKDLLRRRSEHNDGELTSLEEIALHQFDIEKIENIQENCKKLKILLLQNNQISKIENLHKLKSLRYLNLAINNITIIENLSGLESLQKLDLTVNFIEDLNGVRGLRENIFLTELFLVGNPCTSKPGYKDFVIGCLPGLQYLDAREIEKSERILASQVFPDLEQQYLAEALEKMDVSIQTSYLKEIEDTGPATEEELEKKRAEFQSKVTGHTPEARIEAARDLAKMREGKREQQMGEAFKAKPRKEPPPPEEKDGRILQKNEGKWRYEFKNSTEAVILDVEISKFLDTSLIKVDVHPTWIRVLINSKVLQLMLPEKVSMKDVVMERSRLTGYLVVTMLKTKFAGSIDMVELQSKLKTRSNNIGASVEKKPTVARNRRLERLGNVDFVKAESVDFRNIVVDETKNVLVPKPNEKLQGEIKDVKYVRGDFQQSEESFVDDPSVPPLC